MNLKFKHIGSFIFLCMLWTAFIPTTISTSDTWYSVDSTIDLVKAFVRYIIGVAFLSTAIIAVMLHRIHDTLREMREQNETIGNNAVESATCFDESISKLNERLKKVAGTINEIKDIEQKISERPPVIIQKKESN